MDVCPRTLMTFKVSASGGPDDHLRARIALDAFDAPSRWAPPRETQMTILPFCILYQDTSSPVVLCICIDLPVHCPLSPSLQLCSNECVVTLTFSSFRPSDRHCPPIFQLSSHSPPRNTSSGPQSIAILHMPPRLLSAG